MAWIKLRTDLPSDPAVYKMSAALGMDRFSVVGRLAAFWGWADQHAVDGAVDGASSQVVDDVVSLPGFADALQRVKWLQIEADRVVIPNHDRHNGANAKERSLKSERQAKWRAGKAPQTTPEKAAKTVDGKASTRGEKRREDKSIGGSDLFDRFYAAYPRKVGKDAAKKAFDKREVDEALLGVMVLAIQRQGLKARCAKGESQYVPHPATWLNEGRWQDEDGAVDDDPYDLRKAINAEEIR